ncbi:hypothetical protein DLAC_06879 [Tieghemostelium lacteum]|uniref:Uncharacterized protein n=1 Tax=Tieghemostelium lacteum TaxID=361077 RepID=A0A151ZDM5_TIELA|nr:hypothetical protein DLAC_06879 [Tieghemostelium lacteum]|eukprot:KYQ92047.1 hypothetical protein DLAC_06879 [Tieghemostelium lacteum]
MFGRYYSVLYPPENAQGPIGFKIGMWKCVPSFDENHKPYLPEYSSTKDISGIYAFFTIDPTNGLNMLEYIGKVNGTLYDRIYDHLNDKADPYYELAQKSSYYCYLKTDVEVNHTNIGDAIADNMESHLIMVFYSPGNIIFGNNFFFMVNLKTNIRDIPVDFLETVQSYYQEIVQIYSKGFPQARLFPRVKRVLNRLLQDEPVLGG